MTIILQEAELLTQVVLRDGTIIKRAEMREHTTSDGRVVLDCGNCGSQTRKKKYVLDEDGIISESL